MEALVTKLNVQLQEATTQLNKDKQELAVLSKATFERVGELTQLKEANVTLQQQIDKLQPRYVGCLSLLIRSSLLSRSFVGVGT